MTWVSLGGAVVVVVVVVLAVAVAKARVPTAASNGAATHTVAPTATPTAVVSTNAPTTDAPDATPTAGFGDTATNPDLSFICAAQANESGTVIAYATIAGSDATSGSALCADLEQMGPWIELKSIAAGSIERVPGCYLTSADGAVTARIYGAIPSGDEAMTKALCTALFNSAGVSP
jgi:hypothetical protein